MVKRGHATKYSKKAKKKSKGSGWIDEESRSIGRLGLGIQQRKRW